MIEAMTSLLPWFWWLDAQLKAEGANPRIVYQQNRAAFGVTHALIGRLMVAFIAGNMFNTPSEIAQYQAIEEANLAMCYFTNRRLSSRSLANAQHYVREAIYAMQKAGFDIPF